MMPELLKDALSTFSEFGKLLQIELKSEKLNGAKWRSPRPPREFPSGNNRGKLSVWLTDEKKHSRLNLARLILNEDRVFRHVMDGLVGKFNYSKSTLFGKFARPQMRSLYQNCTEWSILPICPPGKGQFCIGGL